MTKKSRTIICIGIILTSVILLALGSFIYRNYRVKNEIIIICVYGIILTAFYLWILLQKSDSAHLKSRIFPFMIIFYHVFNMAVLIFGMNLPAVYRPVCAVPMLLTLLFGIKTGLASMVLYSIVTVLFGLDPIEAILLYLIFGVAGSFIAATFKNTFRLITGCISLVAIYALIYAGLNYYTYGEFVYADVLTGALGGAIQILVFLCFFPFIAYDAIYFNIEKKLKEICSPDFKPLKELKERSPEIFEHSMMVAKLAGHASEVLNVNKNIVRAGAIYHEIGQGLGGNYIKKGIEICVENKVPDVVCNIVKEHNINVAKPSMKESAVVMLADTIISTIDGFTKKGTPVPDREKLVEKVLTIRMQKGCLDDCELTVGELNKIRDAFCRAWRKKDGDGEIEELLLDEPLPVPNDSEYENNQEVSGGED